MKIRSCIQVFSVVSLLVGLSAPILAVPVDVGPPVIVEGQLLPYARVKKDGLIWYPATVVGYQRGISFAYDHGSRTLFANGVETQIAALVVDNVVYVNLTPKVTQQEMRPGMNTLELRQDQLRQMESASPHLEGHTDAVLMAKDVAYHPHPWTTGPEQDEGPLIDLDPTSEEPLAPHMQPGSRPPDAPPARLPNRLPPTSGIPSSSEVTGVVEVPYSGGAGSQIPVTVTSQGGPDSREVANLTPVDSTPPQRSAAAFEAAGALRAIQAENPVFQVKVVQGDWQVNSKDKILRVKLEQLNRSRVAQSNLGSFAVRCEDGSRVEASRTRSYLPDKMLDPGSGRVGELVFRFTGTQIPQSLELEGALQLSLPLILK